MKHKHILFLIFIFFINIQIFAENNETIEVNAVISPFIIQIGDIINYTLEVKSAVNQKIEIPNIDEQLSKFQITDRITPFEKIEKGKKITTINLKFYTYETGKHIIPPIKIMYGKETTDKEILSGSVYVRVDSLLNPDERDIRDIIKPKIQKNENNNNKIKLIFFVLAILSIIIIYYFFRKRKLKKESILLTPWEEALNDLSKLIESDLLIKNSFQEYYFQLSDILRFYIEKRFHLSAPERTTEEFIKLMQNEKVFTETHKNLIRQFLTHSDLVKFAKATPLKEETNKVTVMVQSFIEDTIPEPLSQKEVSK